MKEKLEHTFYPEYLKITLDHTVTYKEHFNETKNKEAIRNIIMRKFSGSKWGASLTALKFSAIVLCYSAAESVCPTNSTK